MKPEKGLNVPDDLKYSETQFWIRMSDDITGTCGITDFAQNSVGDITFVEFINNILHLEIDTDEKIALIESPSDTLDIYSIVPGKIIEINRSLEDDPDLLNNDPYGDGWIYRIEVDDSISLDELLEPDEYLETIIPDDLVVDEYD